MDKNRRKKLLIAPIIMLIVIIGRIALHYSENGYYEFLIFELLPLHIVFFMILTLILYINYKLNLSRKSIIESLIILIGAATVYFVIVPQNLDKVDWEINYNKRQKIVGLVKENQLKQLTGAQYQIPDSLALFPFLKSKEVLVQTSNNQIHNITFYTDKGLTGQYSGFIYTENNEVMKSLIRMGSLMLEENWFYLQR